MWKWTNSNPSGARWSPSCKWAALPCVSRTWCVRVDWKREVWMHFDGFAEVPEKTEEGGEEIKSNFRYKFYSCLIAVCFFFFCTLRCVGCRLFWIVGSTQHHGRRRRRQCVDFTSQFSTGLWANELLLFPLDQGWVFEAVVFEKTLVSAVRPPHTHTDTQPYSWSLHHLRTPKHTNRHTDTHTSNRYFQIFFFF